MAQSGSFVMSVTRMRPLRPSSQVVLGSDHPFPWPQKPVDHVLNTSSLSDTGKAAILGGNALQMLGLP
jgi:aminocarboxymuconate-semialdehyde decarboxylase